MRTTPSPALVALAGLAAASAAASAQLELRKCVIAGGGGDCRGESLRLRATIGQPVVGTCSAERLEVNAGFWMPQGSCNPADFARPFGQLDIADVVAFLQLFGAMDPAADLAAPAGQFDIADVVAFLQIFGAGCP